MSKAITPPARGTPEAVERRQLRVDLSGLNEMQRRHRAGLIGFGQTAFGERWRTDFAAAIGAELGRTISVAQVAHWISGTRPVPDLVYEACLAISQAHAEDLTRRSAILSSRSWTDSREREDGRVYVAEPPAGDKGNDDA